MNNISNFSSNLFLRIFIPHEYREINYRYRKSNRFERMGYEENFMRYLQGLINDVEKRIRRGHQRLALNSMQGTVSDCDDNEFIFHLCF